MMRDGYYRWPCGGCGTVHHWVSENGNRHHWQLGDNPEHALILLEEEWRSKPGHLVWEWIEAIHEREGVAA